MGGPSDWDETQDSSNNEADAAGNGHHYPRIIAYIQMMMEKVVRAREAFRFWDSGCKAL